MIIILWKGYIEQTKEYVDVLIVNLKSVIAYVRYDDVTCGWISLSKVKLLHFLDLRDIHGNPLYEGDIVRTYHVKYKGIDDFYKYFKVGVIEKNKGHYIGVRIKWKKGHMMLKSGFQLSHTMKAEKLGNIYKNSELLEVPDEEEK